MSWVLLLSVVGGIVAVDLPDEATCKRILVAANEKGIVVHLHSGADLKVEPGGGLRCLTRSDYEEQSKPKAAA